MKISICARGFPLSEALDRAVRNEARAFERSLASLPGRISVRLYDINGARGGADMACSVQAELGRRLATVVATDVDANMYRAIAGAFAKLERGARSVIARSRAIRRRAVPSRHPAPV